MRLWPIVNATLPDGTIGTWFCGAADNTIRATEISVQQALRQAHYNRGTDPVIRFISGDNRCRYLMKVKQQQGAVA
jgi:hypothetical protein